jgi:hypothetical protein
MTNICGCVPRIGCKISIPTGGTSPGSPVPVSPVPLPAPIQGEVIRARIADASARLGAIFQFPFRRCGDRFARKVTGEGLGSYRGAAAALLATAPKDRSILQVEARREVINARHAGLPPLTVLSSAICPAPAIRTRAIATGQPSLKKYLKAWQATPEAVATEAAAAEATATEAAAPETTATDAAAPETTATDAAASEATATEPAAPEATATELAAPEATATEA